MISFKELHYRQEREATHRELSPVWCVLGFLAVGSIILATSPVWLAWMAVEAVNDRLMRRCPYHKDCAIYSRRAGE